MRAAACSVEGRDDAGLRTAAGGRVSHRCPVGRVSMPCPAHIVLPDVTVRCKRPVGAVKGGRYPSPHRLHEAPVTLGGVRAVLQWNAVVPATDIWEGA